jgi:hypothetical protein
VLRRRERILLLTAIQRYAALQTTVSRGLFESALNFLSNEVQMTWVRAYVWREQLFVSSATNATTEICFLRQQPRSHEPTAAMRHRAAH